jgi:DNA-directed RNA polymerase II subunit RPB2
MERDAVISHGISNFLKESTVEKSDKYTCFVSDHTGEISSINKNKNIYFSPNYDGPLEFEGNTSDEIRLTVQDKKSNSFSRIEIPYSVKLLIQECEALGVSLRIITDKYKEQIEVIEDIKDEEKITNKRNNKE